MILSTLASLEQLNYGNWSVLILLIKAEAYTPRVSNFNNLQRSNLYKICEKKHPKINQQTIRSCLIHL